MFEFKTREEVCFLPGKQTMAAKLKADFMIFGGARGSAKSSFLVLKPLMYIDDPMWRGIFFRRIYKEIMGAGGLFQSAKTVYPLFGGKPVGDEFRFPSEAIQQFSHMYREEDAETHRGLQYSFVGFDEIDKFSKYQVTFLMTCLRSAAAGDSFCIGTCNPNPDSWVYDLVKWYLDEDGNPDENKCGVIRYFILHEEEFLFADSEEYFKEHHPDLVYVENPKTKQTVYVGPKTFTFVNATIWDNEPLITKNPRYLAELNSLPEVERARNFFGNWHAREKGSNYFSRGWLKNADSIPEGCTVIARAWDKASTEVSAVNRYPDFSAASPRGYYNPETQELYLVGDYIEENFYSEKDGLGEKYIHGKFRKNAGERDVIMVNQAIHDGREDCVVIIPEETAGKDAFESIKDKFTREGILVVKDVMPKNSSKLAKFEPFSSAAQSGKIYILRHTFTDQTYQEMMKELERFNPLEKKSVKDSKDDWVDAMASLYNYCRRAKTRYVGIGPSSSYRKPKRTMAARVLSNITRS